MRKKRTWRKKRDQVGVKWQWVRSLLSGGGWFVLNRDGVGCVVDGNVMCVEHAPSVVGVKGRDEEVWS